MSMNYERMWFALKESLIDSRNDGDISTSLSARLALHKMDGIEVKEAKKAQQSGNVEPNRKCTCECGGHKPDTDQEECKNSKADVFLKSVFGKDMVTDLEELANRIDAKTDDEIDFLMVDGNLDIPEELEDAAREKGLIFARVEKVGKGSIPLPGIPFPGVMMGSIISGAINGKPRKKDPNK